VDLFPTLTRWLLPEAAPAGLEGDDLLASIRPPARDAKASPSLAFSETGPRGRERYRSVQDQRFKLIYAAPHQARAPRLELYDLASDPLEEHDLAAVPESEQEIRRLLRPLESWMKAATASAAREPRTEEQLKALKALGYVD